VRVSWVGMKIPCLESWSTMTRMAVCPAEAGSCSMRSIDMESHVVLESPVQSGLLPIFGKTKTKTGL